MKIKMGLVSALIIPTVLILGCSAQPGSEPTPGETKIEVTYDEFQAQNHITRDIEITLPDELVVSLYSNPTTGYQWGETAQMSDTSVMSQHEHNFAEPQSEEPAVGAGGKDVWAFKSLKKGATTIIMRYNRPWESDMGEWTYTLNVPVK